MLRRLLASSMEATPRAKGIARIAARRRSGGNFRANVSAFERVVASDALRKINLKLTNLSPDEREVCKALVKYIDLNKNAPLEDIATFGILPFRKKQLTLWIGVDKSKLPASERPKARSVGVKNHRETVGEITPNRAIWLLKYLIKEGIVSQKKV